MLLCLGYMLHNTYIRFTQFGPPSLFLISGLPLSKGPPVIIVPWATSAALLSVTSHAPDTRWGGWGVTNPHRVTKVKFVGQPYINTGTSIEEDWQPLSSSYKTTRIFWIHPSWLTWPTGLLYGVWQNTGYLSPNIFFSLLFRFSQTYRRQECLCTSRTSFTSHNTWTCALPRNQAGLVTLRFHHWIFSRTCQGWVMPRMDLFASSENVRV